MLLLSNFANRVDNVVLFAIKLLVQIKCRKHKRSKMLRHLEVTFKTNRAAKFNQNIEYKLHYPTNFES